MRVRTQRQSPVPEACPPTDAAATGQLEGALHDVANALTVMLAWLDTAVRESGTPLNANPPLRMVLDWGRHARAIALRAIGNRADDDDDQPVDCNLFAHDAAAGIHPQASARNVRVVVEVSPDVGVLGLCEPLGARQVLTNLLLNAVAFSPEGAEVRLQAWRDGDNAVFAVTDQGPGLSPQQREHVFERGRSTRAGGSGIGLFAAQRLAAQHDGSLRLVPSEHGAVFELRWPTCVVREERRRCARSSRSVRGRRVLVVEDDLAVSTLLQTALEARGAVVVCASDEPSLNAALSAGPFDGALVDLSPLQDDVQAALTRIRSALAEQHLVLISGTARPPDPSVLQAANAWVRKPFEIADIVAALIGDDRNPPSLPSP